jgi:hypothetical protein
VAEELHTGDALEEECRPVGRCPLALPSTDPVSFRHTAAPWGGRVPKASDREALETFVEGDTEDPPREICSSRFAEAGTLFRLSLRSTEDDGGDGEETGDCEVRFWLVVSWGYSRSCVSAACTFAESFTEYHEIIVKGNFVGVDPAGGTSGDLDQNGDKSVNVTWGGNQVVVEGPGGVRQPFDITYGVPGPVDPCRYPIIPGILARGSGSQFVGIIPGCGACAEGWWWRVTNLGVVPPS